MRWEGNKNGTLKIAVGDVMSMAPLQVSLAVTRGVKFQRITMEGGWCNENVSLLLEQSKEISTRLSACTRVVKTLLPVSKA